MPLLVGIGWLLLALLSPAQAATPCTTLEVFVREGCPHCARAEVWLTELGARRPGLDVRLHDIVADPAARERMLALSAAAGIERPGVPTFLACGEILVGFDTADTTGATVEALLSATDPQDAAAASRRTSIELPWLGQVDARELGLPLFTVAVGLVDGFNPCAMWVLLFLLSILVNLGDRTRILLVAGTFVAVSGLAYFAFMAAWLNVFLLVGFSRAAQVVLGLLALAIGAISLRDALGTTGGYTLAIPESAKPGIYARVRGIVTAPNIPAALAGAAVLAVLVNTVELLCTAGLPALYTHVLGQQALPAWGRYAYLALYNLVYMADDILMVTLVVVSLRRFKLQQRAGRTLKLLSGGVIVLLGVALLLRPQGLI